MIRTNLNENLPEKLDLCAECAEQLFFHMSEKKYCSTEISNPSVFAFYLYLKNKQTKISDWGKNFAFCLCVCVFCF